MTSPDTFKIYCGNLSPSTSGNDLKILFSKYGDVVEADVIIGKNFGFVHMANESDGMKALCLQGYIFNGEKMVVQRAINSKKASVTSTSIPVKRNIVGQGIGSLDDFENSYEVNDNTSYISNYSQHPATSSSPVNYNVAVCTSNKEDSSGRPSPLQLSSASSTSYTPEHSLLHPKSSENKSDNLENMLINQDKSACGICHEEYNNLIHIPKILSCHHTFCSDCLTSLAKGYEIKCPLRCRYVTVLREPGVSGLTTNEAKIVDKIDNVLQCPSVQENGQQSYEQEVCCMCLCIPPGKLCAVQKHLTMRESEALQFFKPQLHNIVEMSMNTLRNVMTLQATLKERMQYTLHSLSKFAEELKLKIEGEEQEQKIQQSLLFELHEMNDALSAVTNITDLLKKFSNVSSSYQSINHKFRHCYAKDTVNGALQSILLELKDPLTDSGGLAHLGLSRKEAFSLASTLKENADKGNFANVLLIYLLSDLLFTRYRPTVVNPSLGFSPFAHSFGNTPTSSLSPLQLETDLEVEPEDIFDINSVIETTKAIESNVPNGASHSQERFSPVVSSALSLGLSNVSLIGSDSYKSSADEPEIISLEDTTNENSRPVSYLDAVKKPAKQPSSEGQSRPVSAAGGGVPAAAAAKPIPSPMKPSTKFPHCWMVISINGVTSGRIIFQLRPDKAPNMCDNFIGLCTGRSGYGYKGTHFFKNGDGFLVGGDVENDDGTGGYSVYNKQKFEADLCPLKDDVGMVRFKGIGTSENGRGMVGSQFMIWYTEREFKKFSFSLVFGKVVDGLNIVQQAANHNLHKDAIRVEECGAI